MKQTIYIDILIILNMVINYLLLAMTGKLSKTRTTKIRMLFGAVVGAMFSLIILFPPLNPLVLAGLKFGFSLLIVLLAFGIKSKKDFVKHLILFYLIGFIFAGCMMGGWIFFSPMNMKMNNGVVYFNFSMGILLVATVSIYLLLSLILEVYGKISLKHTLYDVEIHTMGNTLCLKGFLDTGNQLRDIYSGKPVVMLPLSIGRRLLHKSYVKEIEAYFQGVTQGVEHTGRIKYLPYQSVSTSAMLPSVPLERLVIKTKEKWVEKENIILAMTKDSLGDGSYDVLLNALLFTQ